MAVRAARSASAGILLYRLGAGGVEVLLVHPGGPFWQNKDVGAWQIPKGGIEAGEVPATAAAREFAEELGSDPGGPLVPLGDFRQAGGKRVHLFTVEGDFDPKSLRSNLTKVEWPPRSGRSMTVPEIDRVRWFPVAQARTMMLASQIVALDRLADHLR